MFAKKVLNFCFNVKERILVFKSLNQKSHFFNIKLFECLSNE